jgi:hypothetical protein
MKRILFSLLLLLCLVPAATAASGCNVSVGTAHLFIPAPGSAFVPVGDAKLDSFDHMVPNTNRLVCAFLTPAVLAKLQRPATELGHYMLVEVIRSMDSEDKDITSEYFEQFVTALKQQLGDSNSVNRTFKSQNEELRGKLKAMNSSSDLQIGKPFILGPLFQKKDAYGFAMIVPVTGNGSTRQVVNASAFIRVKNRLVFMYIYDDYTDENAVKRTGELVEDWANQILAANAK